MEEKVDSKFFQQLSNVFFRWQVLHGSLLFYLTQGLATLYQFLPTLFLFRLLLFLGRFTLIPVRDVI